MREARGCAEGRAAHDLDAINLMISTVMASGMAEEFGEDERMAGITVFALTDAAFVRVDT
ncbi:hypothetical protein QJS10_CPA03g00119 [Acorus calamus]|uniref:Uncharacterized protein n=1 Tax=Acorus calamus TaxID=4465 RepID=A0AAV9F2R2_ACOCL|nr:hypothetical protein QJS10_CPA03g00119 [Acorus calamus]